MNKETLIAAIRDIVKPYTKEEEALNNLNENTDFVTDLQINSANLVDIILDVEEKFNIVIDNDSMERMMSVKAAIEIIEAKLAGQ
ncbi:acyl carrier protein [Chitinophaga oryziterrae]|uniref:Acyl carrier protein n=1 Tax=Chitinophaga oryziterrae TaxID=1031224 RepID=A0A6N8J6V4_9BACT|nr:phosphopantetheine-binding protein [Chitinophaga oryziterrae]MVT40361.1 acyl carrier protein [Chitinophaga oryziterrae]